MGKNIQPVTDQICKEHGLKQLVFDEERKGISYAEWNAKTQGTMDWKTIIRADIDAAVRSSNSIQEFEKQMRQMGYQNHKAYLKSMEHIILFWHLDRKRAWRNYRLGERYSYEKLLLRISDKKQFYYERAGIKKLYACRWHTKQPVLVKGLQKKYLQTQILVSLAGDIIFVKIRMCWIKKKSGQSYCVLNNTGGNELFAAKECPNNGRC